MDIYEYNNLLFKDYPDIVNVEQLQTMLNIKRTKAYELLKNGQIKSIRIGRDYKIAKINVIRYLQGEDIAQ